MSGGFIAGRTIFRSAALSASISDALLTLEGATWKSPTVRQSRSTGRMATPLPIEGGPIKIIYIVGKICIRLKRIQNRCSIAPAKALIAAHLRNRGGDGRPSVKS